METDHTHLIFVFSTFFVHNHTALDTQDHHTVENLIMIGTDGVDLVVLGILLFEPCHCWSKIQHEPCLEPPAKKQKQKQNEGIWYTRETEMHCMQFQ